MTPVLVALGAVAGAAVRLLVARRLPGPRGTLAVNLAGSLLLGLLATAGRPAYTLLGTGFCGTLTTFSTFALEAVERRSGRYVAVTVVATLLACAAGMGVARLL